jgi:hypothetical protein
MSDRPISSDRDTDRLLRVISWSLSSQFRHTDVQADALVRSFYTRFAARFDDDFYHHEGAFRCAALIHYSAKSDGSVDFSAFLEWYHSEDRADAEQQTLAYFREFYFEKPA